MSTYYACITLTVLYADASTTLDQRITQGRYVADWEGGQWLLLIYNYYAGEPHLSATPLSSW